MLDAHPDQDSNTWFIPKTVIFSLHYPDASLAPESGAEGSAGADVLVYNGPSGNGRVRHLNWKHVSSYIYMYVCVDIYIYCLKIQ